jgi:hypothetical protein
VISETLESSTAKTLKQEKGFLENAPGIEKRALNYLTCQQQKEIHIWPKHYQAKS